MDRGFYDARTAVKQRTRDNAEMRALVRRIADWCALGPGSRVLDYGCFDGYVLRGLRDARGIEGIGVDISPAAIEAAVEDARAFQPMGHLEFSVVDGSASVPYPDASFDAVICSEVLEHVDDAAALLRELRRVLRPGGRLFATMPNALEDISPPLRPLCRRVDAIEGHVRRMTRDGFLKMLRSAGLRPHRVRYSGYLATGLWYRAVIYNACVKAGGLAMVESGSSWLRRPSRVLADALIHVYLAADRPFSGHRGCMGIVTVSIRD